MAFTQNHSSVLHLAASHGHVEIIRRVIERFPNRRSVAFRQFINETNHAGKSACDNAAYSAPCRRVLLEHSYIYI